MAPNPPTFTTGKKVAIIGSGPAGLACADQLNKAGHKVTVYDRNDRMGGLLMYGIPKYVTALPKKSQMLNISHAEHEARQVHCAPPHRLDGRRGRGKARALHALGLTKTSDLQVFVPNAHVGVDVDIRDIRANNDAVVLCTGATWPRDLKIKGRDADGIHFAMEYLQVS